MAVPVEQRNILTYLNEFQERVRRRTNINLFDKDSKTQALIDIFSEQLLNERQTALSAFDSLQWSQAKGEQLDKLGSSLGVQRLLETFPSMDRSELNLAFYVDSGTFGDLNGGSGFTIPKGTRVWSDTQQNDLGKKITYTLQRDVSCASGESLAYASALSEASGPDFNIGASVLRNHEFTSYTVGTGLRVINFYSVLNGRKRESDDQYRFRISQFYASTASSNETKAKLTALSVPGVLESKPIEGYFGIGTMGLVILGSEFQSNDLLISSVQQALKAVSLPGVKVTAVSAVNALLDIELTVKATRTLTASEQNRLQNTLRSLSINYLRSKGLGGTISLRELATIFAQYTNGLIQFKTSAIDVFDHVFVRRGYVSSVVSERETLSSTYYTLEQDEFADLGTLTLTLE